MLNPDLKLNENLFDEGVEMRPTRDGFGEGLLELGEKNPNVVGLCADLTESTKMNKFAEKYPDRFFRTRYRGTEHGGDGCWNGCDW